MNKRKVISIAMTLILALYFGLVLDIGLNTKYFIKRDLGNALLARKTGNCDLFKSYIYNDIDKWGERCIQEKDGDSAKINEFIIEDITVNGRDAFVEVRLKRDILPALRLDLTEAQLDALAEGYSINYDLIKDNSGKFLMVFPKSKWLIKNELRSN